jgi:HAD superfamily hydrolase (TIGR01509 family)
VSGLHIIFDCDGVLVDSEWLACEVEAELLAGCGIELAPHDIARRFIGSTVHQMFAEIEADAGFCLPDDFMPRYRTALEAAFAERLMAIRGIEAAMERLTTNRSVASNSPIGRVRHALAVTGLDRHFDPLRVFSADMVARPKPAPDLHRHILSATATRAGDAIVIEDSASGVAAARQAGLRVLGFVGASHCGDGLADRLMGAGAERVFAHMHDVADYLEAP